MTTARIFMNGRSQTVRLPQEFRFDQDEVCISRMGDVVLLYPCSNRSDLMTRAIELFTDDFMEDREQPETADERESL